MQLLQLPTKFTLKSQLFIQEKNKGIELHPQNIL